MSDSRNITRSSEIHLKDESVIEVTIAVAIQTDSDSCIANERINSSSLSKTLALIEYMLITACECSTEDMQEMVKNYGN
jgi:hypothetical protein